MSAPESLLAQAWTPDRVDLLRRHYVAGLSAAESGILLGVSRNAVISKRTRLGLVGVVRQGRQPGGEAAKPAEMRLRLPPEMSFRRVPLPRMDTATPPDARPKSLMQRTRGECAWPLGPAEEPGDWRTLFCCAPVRPAGRYCAVHAARARR